MKKSFPAAVHLLTLFVIAVFFTGCAPMPVKIISDASFDSSNYKTYNILPNEQDNYPDMGLARNQVNSIILDTIDKQLANKGYTKIENNPDLLISYYLVGNAKTDTFVVNQYYSGLGYQPVPGRSYTRDSLKFGETTYEEGILIIDMIDTKSKTRVWHGYLTSRTDVYKDEERKERRLHNSVVKILTGLPSVY